MHCCTYCGIELGGGVMLRNTSKKLSLQEFFLLDFLMFWVLDSRMSELFAWAIILFYLLDKKQLFSDWVTKNAILSECYNKLRLCIGGGVISADQ